MAHLSKHEAAGPEQRLIRVWTRVSAGNDPEMQGERPTNRKYVGGGGGGDFQAQKAQQHQLSSDNYPTARVQQSWVARFNKKKEFTPENVEPEQRLQHYMENIESASSPPTPTGLTLSSAASLSISMDDT